MTKKLLTKKILSILNKEYRNILIKCALLNACAYMFMPAVANADTDNIYLHPGSIFAEEDKGAYLDIYGTDTSVSKVTVNNVMDTGAYPIPE